MALLLISNKFGSFFFLLNSAIYKRQFTKDLMSQTVKQKMSPIYIFYCIASYFLKLHYVSKLVNLNYVFEINLKAIIGGSASQFHNGIHLKILLIFM